MLRNKIGHENPGQPLAGIRGGAIALRLALADPARGHLPHVEQPARFAAMLGGWLAGTAERPAMTAG